MGPKMLFGEKGVSFLLPTQEPAWNLAPSCFLGLLFGLCCSWPRARTTVCNVNVKRGCIADLTDSGGLHGRTDKFSDRK